MLIKSRFVNFLNASLRLKNISRKITAKIVSEVCVRAVADRAMAINTNECFRSILRIDQKTRITNDWDKTEGQWPHKSPVDAGNEKISMERGSDNIATVLLNSLITKYMTSAAITAKNATTKYIAS